MKIIFDNEEKIFNIHTEGIPYLSFELLDSLGVPNLYSTRYEAFDSETGEGVTGLRLALMKGDCREEAVPVLRRNRDRLARQLGSSVELECVTDQKHTSYVHVASQEDLGFEVSAAKPLHRQYVDGIVTDIPGALLTAYGADCPPVYIVDPVRRASGLVHAGWRGTLGRIPEVAAANMTVRFGCRPEDMYAAIGPGICAECYEMGDEIYDAFAGRWGTEDADRLLRRRPSGKYHLDLREANRLTLLRAGIPEEHIAVSNVCTKCNADIFYSYRARRMENEQAAMLVNSFEGTEKNL